MANLLNLLFAIPVIGGWISLGVLLGPPVFVMILIATINDNFGSDYPFPALLIFSIATFLWLKALENYARVRLSVPIIRVPYLWLTWVGMVIGSCAVGTGILGLIVG